MAKKNSDTDDPDDRGLAYWQELVQGVADTSKQLDKLVTTLTAGALALSLAFIRDIAQNPGNRWLLAVSWSCLCVALALTLTSLVASGVAHEGILRQLHGGKSVDEIDPNPRSAKVTRWLAWLSVPALLAGVVFLVWFALVNLDSGGPI